MIKYVPKDSYPEEYLSLSNPQFWEYARGVFRAIVYYFLVIVIGACSRMVSKMGTRLVEKLEALESKQEVEDKRECKLLVEDRFGEVYRLSTVLMRGMYLRLKDQAAASLDEYTQEQQRLLDEEMEMQQAIVSGAVDSDEELTPEEEEGLQQLEATPRRAAAVRVPRVQVVRGEPQDPDAAHPVAANQEEPAAAARAADPVHRRAPAGHHPSDQHRNDDHCVWAAGWRTEE